MASLNLFDRLKMTILVILVIPLVGCTHPLQDAGGFLGAWTGVAIAGSDGDTLHFEDPSPLLVLESDGRFEEIRGERIVSRGTWRLKCEITVEIQPPAEACVEFLARTGIFHDERHWVASLRGDTLFLQTLLDDGYDHIFERE